MSLIKKIKEKIKKLEEKIRNETTITTIWKK